MHQMETGIVDTPPAWITIGITNKCNNHCSFCAYHAREAKGNSNVYNIPFQPSFKDFKRIVDMAKVGGVKHVHICGTGEPFLNSDILKMMDYCISTFGKTSLQTNYFQKVFNRFCYLDEIIKRKESIAYITTDILSGDAEQHNSIKKGSNLDEILDSLERLSQETEIKFNISWVLTKVNYDSIPQLIDKLIARNINNAAINVSNIFTYDFNEMTSSEIQYASSDTHITQALSEAKGYGDKRGIPVRVPQPSDYCPGCTVFWEKVQIWPANGNDPDRYHENLIPHACRAVVKGNLNSLGYIFDYDSIMDFWNNDKLVTIRKNLLKEIYPSKECQKCYCCKTPENFKYQEI